MNHHHAHAALAPAASGSHSLRRQLDPGGEGNAAMSPAAAAGWQNERGWNVWQGIFRFV